ncbi:hypothetical protein Tco_1169642 [Tanacetum coccineum]
MFTLVSGSADLEGLIKKVITHTMTEPTTKEYVNKTRGDYYSGITKIMINGKAAYELKGKFLDDFRKNAFSGTNGEDAIKHIENILNIVDPLNLSNVSYERLRLAVFSISPIRDASEWLMNEPQSSITTWVDLTDKLFGKYYPLSCTGAKTYEEYENEWFYKLNNDVPWDPEEPWLENGVPYELIGHICESTLADVGSETRPLILERGSYIPWASHFRRYLNRKRENRKWLNKEIDEGPYEFKEFTPSESEPPRMQKEEDLKGDD